MTPAAELLAIAEEIAATPTGAARVKPATWIESELLRRSRGDPSGCRLWTGATRRGYGATWLDGKHHGAHRIAWLAWRGAIPSGMQVLHRCDVRACINLDHLFVGTVADNMRDKVAKGRSVDNRGSGNGRAKLNEVAVRVMRFMCARRLVSQKELAEAYGVTQSSVSEIIGRTTWTHVPEDAA